MTCIVYILGKTKGEMIPINIEHVEGRELSEEELHAVYLYLDMYLDSMSDEERMYWLKILTAIDKEFYDDSSNGTDELRDVQGSEGGS